MAAEAVGVAAMVLGAGRERAEDTVDHAVGVVCKAKPGEAVTAGDAIFEVHYRSDARLADARKLLEGAVRIADAPPADAALVLEEIR